MSHFSVLVIGDDPEKQLAPYHEYECTGRDDEYVIDVDITAKVRESYEEDYNAEARAAGQTFEAYARENYSRVEVVDGTVRVVEHTNPNRKWDYYVLGGRWTGYFHLKSDVVAFLGEPGLMTPTPKASRGDRARKSDIDFEGMMNEGGARAGALYDKVASFFGGAIRPLKYEWSRIVAGEYPDAPTDMERRREFYWAQPELAKVKEGEKTDRETFGWGFHYEEFTCSRDSYVERGRNRAVTPFAVVKDSRWYERGRMGWWGMVHNEKDFDAWCRETATLLRGLPPDTLLSIYDCHI